MNVVSPARSSYSLITVTIHSQLAIKTGVVKVRQPAAAGMRGMFTLTVAGVQPCAGYREPAGSRE